MHFFLTKPEPIGINVTLCAKFNQVQTKKYTGRVFIENWDLDSTL